MPQAISQRFEQSSNPKALHDYLRWRDVIFAVTGRQVDILSGRANQVYGVIMDVGLSDDFVITVTAFPTGESSLRTTIGGGAIGLGSNDFIAEHARHIVALAQSLITEARPVDNHNLPRSRKVYFYFLTTSGVMLSETTIEETSVQDHPFHEMFARFTQIKARSEELVDAHNQ